MYLSLITALWSRVFTSQDNEAEESRDCTAHPLEWYQPDLRNRCPFTSSGSCCCPAPNWALSLDWTGALPGGSLSFFATIAVISQLRKLLYLFRAKQKLEAGHSGTPTYVQLLPLGGRLIEVAFIHHLTSPLQNWVLQNWVKYCYNIDTLLHEDQRQNNSCTYNCVRANNWQIWAWTEIHLFSKPLKLIFFYVTALLLCFSFSAWILPLFWRLQYFKTFFYFIGL